MRDGVAVIETLGAAVRDLNFCELVCGRHRADREPLPAVIEFLDVDEADRSLVAMT